MTDAPATHVIFEATGNGGYSPDQITQGVRLGQLLEMVQEAVERYGSEARVVTAAGQRYGANYGFISPTPARASDECEYCEERGDACLCDED